MKTKNNYIKKRVNPTKRKRKHKKNTQKRVKKYINKTKSKKIILGGTKPILAETGFAAYNEGSVNAMPETRGLRGPTKYTFGKQPPIDFTGVTPTNEPLKANHFENIKRFTINQTPTQPEPLETKTVKESFWKGYDSATFKLATTGAAMVAGSIYLGVSAPVTIGSFLSVNIAYQLLDAPQLAQVITPMAQVLYNTGAYSDGEINRAVNSLLTEKDPQFGSTWEFKIQQQNGFMQIGTTEKVESSDIIEMGVINSIMHTVAGAAVTNMVNFLHGKETKKEAPSEFESNTNPFIFTGDTITDIIREPPIHVNGESLRVPEDIFNLIHTTTDQAEQLRDGLDEITVDFVDSLEKIADSRLKAHDTRTQTELSIDNDIRQAFGEAIERAKTRVRDREIKSEAEMRKENADRQAHGKAKEKLYERLINREIKSEAKMSQENAEHQALGEAIERAREMAKTTAAATAALEEIIMESYVQDTISEYNNPPTPLEQQYDPSYGEAYRNKIEQLVKQNIMKPATKIPQFNSASDFFKQDWTPFAALAAYIAKPIISLVITKLKGKPNKKIKPLIDSISTKPKIFVDKRQKLLLKSSPEYSDDDIPGLLSPSTSVTSPIAVATPEPNPQVVATPEPNPQVVATPEPNLRPEPNPTPEPNPQVVATPEPNPTQITSSVTSPRAEPNPQVVATPEPSPTQITTTVTSPRAEFKQLTKQIIQKIGKSNFSEKEMGIIISTFKIIDNNTISEKIIIDKQYIEILKKMLEREDIDLKKVILNIMKEFKAKVTQLTTKILHPTPRAEFKQLTKQIIQKIGEGNFSEKEMGIIISTFKIIDNNTISEKIIIDKQYIEILKKMLEREDIDLKKVILNIMKEFNAKVTQLTAKVTQPSISVAEDTGILGNNISNVEVNSEDNSSAKSGNKTGIMNYVGTDRER